mmetsp:Transcript_35047/g.56712  ORF Transcript_35047/g.56712 Transcript_35047/m.56712 type:complete len:409 (+) Transcript_35047:164-1390(+)
MGEFSSIEDILERYVPEKERAQVNGVLYGRLPEIIQVPENVQALAADGAFEVKAFKFDNAVPEQLRPRRLVRLGLVQHAIVKPTTDPLQDQYLAIEAKVRKIAEAAAAMGVNILALQEAWTCPFFFCTREKYPWCELAETIDPPGPSVRFVREIARKYNMVIIAPILERDVAHGEQLRNTAVIISNTGSVIGKHSKNHIPRVGDFNESTYYEAGTDGHPVFDTAFGKIAVNICYGRHHPLNWLMFGLNGAEIVFNPSATVTGLSEPMWPIEARCAAIANSYFTAGINRVGSEVFPNEFTSGDGKPGKKEFGYFYGSSYVAAPDGSRTPGLSRIKDGLLVSEIDLNLCRQIRDKWTFQMTSRLNLYAESLTYAASPQFKQQIVSERDNINDTGSKDGGSMSSPVRYHLK